MIVAIRHGPVAADGICYGRWNPPVVNPPQADADTILLALPRGGEAVRIVSSPADRCLAIAMRLAARLGLAVTEDPRIAELSMGDWEGKAWEWIERHDGDRLRGWMERWQVAAPPGGESLADLEARVRAAVADADPRGPTLWITHAGVIRGLRVLHHTAAWHEAMQARVPHLSPERFAMDDEPPYDA